MAQQMKSATSLMEVVFAQMNTMEINAKTANTNVKSVEKISEMTKFVMVLKTVKTI